MSTVNILTAASPNRDILPDEPAPHLRPPRQGPGDERINILLVDDEPKNLMVLESVLEDPGYRLVRAESSDRALLALVADEFAVILLDIQMPGMSGFELAQMIKQRRKTASVPIIFLTAHYNEDRHVLEGYQSGAVDYLLKPINSVIVRSKVAVFASLYRKTRESLAANAALSAEVAERRRVQDEMRRLHNQLEQRVAERTSELREANNTLQHIQSELRDTDRRKDQFLAMLGHELRNPLAAICNSVSLMQRIGSDQPDINWCREVIERQSDHLTRLVDDLLDVSRISRGKIQLEKEVLDFGVAVQQAIETCRPLIDARRHDLILSLPDVSVRVEGDSTRLAQVAANLVNNAAKYTNEGGRIWVTVECQAGDQKYAVLRVRDNGRGMDAEAIANLFELFYQADVDLDRSHGGLGVGLALVRSLVQMHGGTVEACSPGRGLGSEFVVRLPCLSPTIVAESASSPLPENIAAAGLLILVVDDNIDAARSLAKMLQILGYQALLAHDGPEAVEIALRERPDVLLLDLGLPRLNGYQVCQSLRKQGLASELIVAVTGYGQDSDRKLTAEAGFDIHLVKPVGLQTIQDLLAKYAAKKQASR
jgi:signal transduction histidine kinase